MHSLEQCHVVLIVFDQVSSPTSRGPRAEVHDNKPSEGAIKGLRSQPK
jgi:hypothetical protein